jgi:putative IMPACT (imprinted ancient) family translation regulator
MLNALLHSGVGDIAAVVTRYYGGTNLGTGGLVRAYAGGVAHALESLPRVERVEFITMSVAVDYGRVSALEQIFPMFEVLVDHRRFDADATFEVRLPDTRVETFRRAVLDLTRGQARFGTGP